MLTQFNLWLGLSRRNRRGAPSLLFLSSLHSRHLSRLLDSIDDPAIAHYGDVFSRVEGGWVSVTKDRRPKLGAPIVLHAFVLCPPIDSLSPLSQPIHSVSIRLFILNSCFNGLHTRLIQPDRSSFFSFRHSQQSILLTPATLVPSLSLQQLATSFNSSIHHEQSSGHQPQSLTGGRHRRGE